MCLAMPGRITAVVDPARRLARVDVLGAERLVQLGLVEGAAPGDWVLVRTGVALTRIDETEARDLIAMAEEMGRWFEEALRPAGEAPGRTATPRRGPGEAAHDSEEER